MVSVDPLGSNANVCAVAININIKTKQAVLRYTMRVFLAPG
jgi:hypothetical protein